MHEYAENKSRVLSLARECLSAPESKSAPLLVYYFEGDREAHDDELQARLEIEFKRAWLDATSELEKEFGQPLVSEEYDETRWVPLSGVGGASLWQTKEGRLWVAYAHEDRETPYLLLVGKLP